MPKGERNHRPRPLPPPPPPPLPTHSVASPPPFPSPRAQHYRLGNYSTPNRINPSFLYSIVRLNLVDPYMRSSTQFLLHLYLVRGRIMSESREREERESMSSFFLFFLFSNFPFFVLSRFFFGFFF